MNADNERLFALLSSAMSPRRNSAHGHKVVDQFEGIPPARNMQECDDSAKIYADFTGSEIAFSILFHIQDHGGENCATKILEEHLQHIRGLAIHLVTEGCKSCDLVNPFETSTHNAALVKEILAEDES